MSTLEKIIQPISPENPCGEDLRYSGLYDQIKSARSPGELQEPDAQAWGEVQQLAATALATQSKDLQLAVWLLEAQTQLDGFAGAAAGLRVIRELLSTYWESLYPALDEEDDDPLYFRTGVLEWINERLPEVLRTVPLTSAETGYSLAHYQVTQETGSVKEALLADGWPTSEQFQTALQRTPPPILRELHSAISRCQTELESLESCTDPLFVRKLEGKTFPALSFSRVKETLESADFLVSRTLRQTDPGEPAQAGAGTPARVPSEQAEPAQSPAGPAAAGPGGTAPSPPLSSAEDAFGQIFRLSGRLLEDNPYRPIPYLLTRAVVWGHLLGFVRLGGDSLPAPSAETRRRLRDLFESKKWGELIRACESALAAEENRAWLDLHYYLLAAMQELGGDYARAALALRGQLRFLLEVHPDLAEKELADGSPAASPQTLRWLREESLLGGPAAALSPGPPAAGAEPDSKDSQAEPIGRLLESGRIEEGLGLLQSRIDESRFGRERFLRRLELAEACLQAGRQDLAFDLLSDLSDRIDRLGLQEWEDPEIIARTWVNLLRCGAKLSGDSSERRQKLEEIRSRLCRLDIRRALNLPGP